MGKYAKYEYIPDFAAEFLYYCKTIKNMSDKTVDEYYLDLRVFFRFIKSRDGSDCPFNEIDASGVTIEEVKKITLSDLYVFLNFVNEERGNAVRARNRKISSLRSFFKFLCKQGILDENPTTYLESPKTPKSLPVYLSVDECVQLLDSIDGKNKERNYAIITLFLNCGLRLSELVGINMNDITGNVLRVTGKGNKQRDVYLNEACVSAIQNYLAVRETYNPPPELHALFITNRKKRISNRMVQTLVSTYLEKANLNNHKYSTHKLRHTAATLMHQNGVDVRVLQEVLGHANLGTTQIYTHLESSELKDAMEHNPLAHIEKK